MEQLEKNVALLLAYDGTNYSGWQRQKNAMTIQEMLETVLEKITKVPVSLMGCGRTDAKVHAKSYYCNFRTQSKIPLDKLPLAMNCLLPDDIVVRRAWEVPQAFHGRFSVRQKTYLYQIDNGPFADPFLKNYACHWRYPLDEERMRQGAAHLLGTHDFVCFMAAGGQVKTTVRTVYDVKLWREDHRLFMEITANGFLYNMVRIIMGTLIYIGCGKLEPEDVKEILEKKDRKLAGITAPPQGLYMKDVLY